METETIKISDRIWGLVVENLSPKTQRYVKNSLFSSEGYTNELLAESPELKNDTLQGRIIGNLNAEETEMFIISQGLLKRIREVRQKMSGMGEINIHSADQEIQRARELYSEVEQELRYLRKDYFRACGILDFLIQHRLRKEMESVFNKNPELIRTEYFSSEYTETSGYVFRIFKGGVIVLDNRYEMGGD